MTALRHTFLVRMGITLLLLSETACIGVKVTGPTGRNMKEDMLKSPLILLSDDFYPENKPLTAKGIAESLPDKQKEQIRGDLSNKLLILEQTHAKFHKYLEEEMGASLPGTVSLGLRLGRSGEPDEGIRNDQALQGQSTPNIHVDVEVLQGFFKAAILDIYKASPGAHSSGDVTANEEAIVAGFLEFKDRLRHTKGRTGVGEIIHWGSDDDAWFQLADMSTEMEKANSQYYGVLLFTMAHEMGHYALGHLKERCDDTKCPRFTERELAADRYAAALLSALIPEVPGSLALFVADPDGNRDSLRGYAPFFTMGYRLAHFSNLSSCSCAYPEPAKREELADAEHERATQRLFAEHLTPFQTK